MTEAAPHLRLVDEQGVVHEECPGCEARERTIEGLESEIRSLATKLRLAKLDDEAKAARDKLWPRGVRLFDLWRERTGHVRSEWTAARFELCRPALRRYPDATIERAIAGIAHDPYTKQTRNGRTERYDTWETLFKKTGSIEWYANRAPRDWEPTGQVEPGEFAKSVARFVLDRARLIEEADDAVEIARIFVEMDRRVREYVQMGKA